MINKFEGFPVEGITDFYDHILSYKPIKNYYLEYIWIINTYRGKPKRWTEYSEWDDYQNKMVKRKIPFTGTCAAGFDSIVEKVFLNLTYFNINHKKHIQKRGLYLRGVCSEDNRTGGTKTMFRRGGIKC